MLSYHLLKVQDLSAENKNDLYRLMQQNYNAVSLDLFLSDLAKKEFAGIIKDEQGVIQGFTTFAINPNNTGTANYNIIFSGDTILDPAHWGSQIMMQGWCETVGSFIAAEPSKKWYWYLMSKGHRTYLYLPIFFESYYPAPDPSPHEAALKKIATEVSPKLFGTCWLPDEGIVRFDQSLGELKTELAQGTFQKSKSRNIGFFLEKNPGFYRGDELICIAEIHPGNMKRSAKSFVEQGMQHPVISERQ